MVDVQVSDVAKARAMQLGEPGERWLTDLPASVDALEKEWGIRVTSTIEGGTASWVTGARTSAGLDVVLKLGVPGPESGRQAATLVAAEGNGFVQILELDLSRHAMLLERLGGSLVDSGLAAELQLEILAKLLRRSRTLSRSSFPDSTPENKAASLAALVGDLAERLDHDCSSAVIDTALEFARRRSLAFSPEGAVPLHGDAAAANVLRALSERKGTEDGWVFVDPNGFLGDPAYDAGVALRDWCPELLAGDAPVLARRFCDILARGTDLDAQAIWEWGFLERVSTGLFALSLGGDQWSAPMFETAALLV